MKPTLHVTMDDIAQRAGVSTATVSMSLRNKPNIPAATRERIVAIARELGYQPNPFVSALMRSRRHGRPISGRPVLALVCALDQADGWRNAISPTRRQVFQGALARAAHHGYQPQEFWLHQQGMSAERFSEMLRARGIQGLLLSPLPDAAPVPALRWDYFSAVSLSVPMRALTVPTVSNDHYFSSLRAVHECHRLGYRRPGLVFRSSHRQHFQGRWEAGFLIAQSTLPDVVPLPPLYVESMEEEAAFSLEHFKRWLKNERPDVIVTMGSEFIERMLTKLGWKVPDDIGLAGMSCPEPGHRVSGIYQNGQRIGEVAVDILAGMMERHEQGLPEQAMTTMVEGLWNEGTTLRPQAAVKLEKAPRKRSAV